MGMFFAGLGWGLLITAMLDVWWHWRLWRH